MNQIILPIATLVLGTLLGLVTTLIASAMGHRKTVELRLLDQFLEVRKQVVQEISDLADLDLRDELAGERRSELAGIVSKLFYQHYDFLPEQVLQALVLLQVSLAKPKDAPYVLRGGVLPMDEADIAPFVESCSMYANARFITALALRSRDPKIRQNAAIRLHARHVLYSLNKFASIKDMLALVKRLKKVPARSSNRT